MVLPIDIVLVRHGECEGNVAMNRGRKGDRSVFQNEKFSLKHSSLYRLTTLGISQAKTAGKWIRENIVQIDDFFVSEYIRSLETAAHLEIPNSGWVVDYSLRKRDCGSKEYKPYEERIKYSETNDPLLGEFFHVPSRGESLAQMCSRLMKVVNELHQKSDRRVLIVCHDQIIRCFRVLFEKIGQEKYRGLSKEFEDPKSENCIHKCQIFHYTRRNPFSGKLHSKLKFMRSVNPWDPDSPSNTGWKAMEDTNKKLGIEDLFSRVNAIPRIIDNSSPANLPVDYSYERFSINPKYEAEIEEEVSDDDEGDGKMKSASSEDSLDGEEWSQFSAGIGEIIGQEEEEDEEEEDEEGEKDEGVKRKKKKKKKKKKRTSTKRLIRLDSKMLKKFAKQVKKKFELEKELEEKGESKKKKKKKIIFRQ